MILVVDEDGSLSYLESVTNEAYESWADGLCDLVRYRKGKFEALRTSDEGDDAFWEPLKRWLE